MDDTELTQFFTRMIASLRIKQLLFGSLDNITLDITNISYHLAQSSFSGPNNGQELFAMLTTNIFHRDSYGINGRCICIKEYFDVHSAERHLICYHTDNTIKETGGLDFMSEGCIDTVIFVA
jgi:hypothetical protein